MLQTHATTILVDESTQIYKVVNEERVVIRIQPYFTTKKLMKVAKKVKNFLGKQGYIFLVDGKSLFFVYEKDAKVC